MSSLLARCRSFLQAALHRGRVEAEMDEEIRFHLQSRAEALVREGLSPQEAARQARLEFGPEAAHRASMRRSLGLKPLDDFLADLRYAWRLLRRSPGFTTVAVVSLGLASGANAAIFSTANELLFARLGVPHARELRSLRLVKNQNGPRLNTWNDNGSEVNGLYLIDVFPYPAFHILAGQVPEAPLFGYQNASSVTMSGAGDAREVQVQMVSGTFYGQMEVQPVLGRILGPVDDRVDRGAPMAAVLGYGFWQREFGGDRTVLGRIVRLNGSTATIVGVNPPHFTGALSPQFSPDLFVPLSAVTQLQPLIGNANPLTSDDLGWVKIGYRAKPGMADNALAARLAVALEALTRASKKLTAKTTLPWVAVEDGSQGVSWFRNQYAKPIYALLGLVVLVLLLACVNVANLMLSRARTRAREMSLRLALGAGRARLFRQLLTECLLLAGIGGAFGFALAFTVRNVVPRLMLNSRGASTLQTPFDWRVFAFTAGVTLASAVLSGLAPAWQATRSEPGETLKEAGLTGTARRRFLGSRMLVLLEVAISLVLVASSALFLRTMWNAGHLRTGFDAHGVLLFNLNLPQQRYAPGQNFRMHQQVLDAVRHLPSVQSASLSDVALLSNSNNTSSFYVQHPVRGAAFNLAEGSMPVVSITPEFFSAMRIPIVAGRAFTEADISGGVRLGIINQSMARKYFPGVDPLGRTYSFSDGGPWTTIVGVCGDTLYDDPHGQPAPLHFDLMRDGDDIGGPTYIVRTTQPPMALVPSLRRAVARLDPDLPVTGIRTQEEQIREVTQQERLLGALSLGFGVLALLLACVGVYGVLSYSVAERTREIGIRLALGASRERVRAAVLREAGALAALGTVCGLGVTLALARVLRSLLFGVAPTDLFALASSAGLLLLLALGAAFIPAARASRVDPMEALRHE